MVRHGSLTDDVVVHYISQATVLYLMRRNVPGIVVWPHVIEPLRTEYEINTENMAKYLTYESSL